VHPTGVNTPMEVNAALEQFLAEHPSLSNDMSNALPVEMLEPSDISNAVLWLVSDEARFVTGVALPVDAGFTNRH
jgi:NAD(P)-dependent dehydrogenase (short-subunit alcohol dehydrogenase family)